MSEETDRVFESLKRRLELAIRDLSVDDAITVCEEVAGDVEGTLMGLRDDKERE